MVYPASDSLPSTLSKVGRTGLRRRGTEQGLHLSLTVPRGVCRAVLTVSTGFATGSRRGGGREGVCSMTAVGQDSSRTKLRGPILSLLPVAQPYLRLCPAVVASPVHSHPFVVAVDRQSPRRSSAADNQLGQRPEFTDNRIPIVVFPFVLCNICWRVPFTRAKVSFALAHRKDKHFFFREARWSEGRLRWRRRSGTAVAFGSITQTSQLELEMSHKEPLSAPSFEHGQLR